MAFMYYYLVLQMIVKTVCFRYVQELPNYIDVAPFYKTQVKLWTGTNKQNELSDQFMFQPQLQTNWV